MTEESFEALFGACVLEVLSPDTSVPFPDGTVADDWLTNAKKPHTERKQAFFDEQLNLLLLVHFKHPSFSDSHNSTDPSRMLGNMLSRIQVSLEATYISQTPNQEVPNTAGLAPPRTSSMPKGRPPVLHPSIFPPNTPNPIPSTTESDRKYVQSEGTLLFSYIWGTKKGREERFALLFSEDQGCWVAVYELSLIVSYLRLPYPDPLLCLTASATLRDKALSSLQYTHPLVAYLAKAGVASILDSGDIADGEDSGEDEEEDEDIGFEEINLLDGLSLDPIISPNSEPLHLPSTRLGNSTRQQFFSLSSLPVPTRTPPSTKQTPNHILRKSYRKVLLTVSGFRVRMRTVFVPHIIFPRKSSVSESGKDIRDCDNFESGSEEREAGNSERTVGLCVEVENSGESGSTMGFSLERLDVKIGGEGATARLIGWGEGALDPDAESHLFPLRIGSMSQYNLLYVVSFWSTPNDQENLLLPGQSANSNSELQRAVTITVYGRPYFTGESEDETNILSYPTQTFSSRWNCILDLSSRPHEEPADLRGTPAGRNALPEPPSPFPGRTPLTSLISTTATIPAPQAIAGKRHSLPGHITAMRAINPATSSRLSLPREYGGGSVAPPVPTAAFTPPSVALQPFNRPASSTFGHGAGGFNVNVSPPDMPSQSPFVTPPKPVHPTTAGTPHAQPFGMGMQLQAYSGPSVEIKRERGTGMMTAVPQTPLPTVLNTQLDARLPEVASGPSGEPIVVSVGILPVESASASGDNYSLGQGKIYPSDQFTLDIFVFNQSSWTRRFEVSYPSADKRRRKLEQNKTTLEYDGKSTMEELRALTSPPGILPLQNRVRVGPLKSFTCQSVRMDFLAISPGVHSVDTLTLTDVGTGYAVHLRSVLDIVVHERMIEEKGEKPP